MCGASPKELMKHPKFVQMKPTLFFLAGCVVAAGCSAVKPVPVVKPVVLPEHNPEADIVRYQKGIDFE